MTNPKPMDPALLAELQDDISERRCGVAYGMALALQDLSSAHDYWKARAARMERERDEARRAQIRCAFGSAGHVMARPPDTPYSEPVRCLTHKEVARVWGWGYLYPESEGDQ